MQALGEIELAYPTIVPGWSRASENGVKDVHFERTRRQPNEDHGAPLAEHSEAWLNALGETAVTSTPRAPPQNLFTSATASVVMALTTASAPILRASDSFSSEISTAITPRPMAFAYWTATSPSSSMPEMTTYDRAWCQSPSAPLDGHAGAEDRSGWFEVQTVRQVAHRVTISEGVLREAAIDGIARILLRISKDSQAVRHACNDRTPCAPRVRRPHAFLDRGYTFAHGGDGPNAFMTRNEGRVGLDRPVAISGMQVRMAHTRLRC